MKRTIETIETITISLDGKFLQQIFKTFFGSKFQQILFTVPRGGDYSGTTLNFLEDNSLKIELIQITKTLQNEEENKETPKKS